MSWLILVFAVLTGMLMPLQAGVNSHLSKHLNEPIHAAFVSFLGGFITIIIVCLTTRKFFPSIQSVSNVPIHLLIGGIFGVIFVCTTIILAHKLGATVLISCLIAGQLSASILLDHFGWLGFTVHPISVPRILGVLLLFVGVVLVRLF